MRERWRDAANVVAARWEAFLHAEAEAPGFAFASYVAALDAEEAAATEWLSSLRAPPDSHNQLVFSASGRSTNSPVPRLRPVTYATLGEPARQPTRVTGETFVRNPCAHLSDL